MATRPKSFLAPVATKRVRLVEEQHAVQRAVDDRVGLGFGLTDVLTDQVGAVHLFDVFFLQKAKAAIDFGDDARNRGLTGPGRAGEHQVVGALSHFESAFFTDQFHRHRALEPRDLILDFLQSDELVELTLGLRQQHGLAFLGAGVDEVAGLGFGAESHGSLRASMRSDEVGTIPKLVSVNASST